MHEYNLEMYALALDVEFSALIITVLLVFISAVSSLDSCGIYIYLNLFHILYHLFLICSIMVYRYDPVNDSYHHDMDGAGLICQAVDILPTEFAKEVKYFHGWDWLFL